MCQSYIYYYPRMGVNWCTSRSLYDSMPNGNMTYTEFMQYAQTTDWTRKSNREDFKRYLNTSSQQIVCVNKDMNPQVTKWFFLYFVTDVFNTAMVYIEKSSTFIQVFCAVLLAFISIRLAK